LKKKKEQTKNKGGAPVGNLNRATSALPAMERLKKGKALPADLQRVLQMAQNESQGLIEHLGGQEVITHSELLLARAWRRAYQGELLIWNHILEGGSAILTDEAEGSWDLQPGVQRLAGLISVQHRILKTLGLERRAKNVNSLEAYVQSKYGREEEE